MRAIWVITSARKRLDRVPTLLKRFRQAVLGAACSGRLTEDWRTPASGTEFDSKAAGDLPDGWRNVPFSEALVSSFYGPRFGSESYSADGVPTIRTTDMGFDGSLTLKGPPRIRLSAAELARFGLVDGDLLVTRTGATIGKCAVYDERIGPAIPGAYLIRFRLHQKFLAPRFALLFFMSPEGQRLLVGGGRLR